VTASPAPGTGRRRNGSGRTGGGGVGTARSGGDAAAGADLTEVFGGRQYLLLGGTDVLSAAGNDKDWFVAARRCLNVRVGLGSQRFDLAAYTPRRHTDIVTSFSLLPTSSKHLCSV